jgi:molybdate transport system substrate-binding protein
MKLALAAVAALALTSGAAAAEPPQLTIYAASSLTEVLPRIDARQRYSFGGSNQLAFQVRQGAPADVFMSASPEFTQALFKDGLVERPHRFCSNKLVLAVPRSNPAGLRTVFDLKRKDVKLVVGNSRVPVGSYTRLVLRKLAMTSVLTKVVSEEPDVKSIVGKVALGQADAGFVYTTDVRAASDRIRAIAIPPWAQPKVHYEVAVVRSSEHRAGARAWVARLSQGRARRLLRASGFGIK